MSKKVDTSGFWFLEKNPISKVGVFEYLGSSISPDCEPDKMYKVFRSAEELSKSVPTWDKPAKPLIDDHEMLGEGFTDYDDRPAAGVLTNPVFENDTLYADLSIYSEDIKEKIESGKKELSLGYFCKYVKKVGTYKGETYDYVQTDIVGNHIALVDAGRMGSDVRVFDSKQRSAFDAVEKPVEKFVLNKKADFNTITNDESQQTEQKVIDMNKYVLLSDVLEALKKGLNWGDEESPTEKLLKELLSEKAVEATPVTAADEDPDKKDEKPDDKKATDEDEPSLSDVLKAIKDGFAALSKDKAKDSEEDPDKKKTEDSDPDDKEDGKGEDEDPDAEKGKAEDGTSFRLTTKKAATDAAAVPGHDAAFDAYVNS